MPTVGFRRFYPAFAELRGIRRYYTAFADLCGIRRSYTAFADLCGIRRSVRNSPVRPSVDNPWYVHTMRGMTCAPPARLNPARAERASI